MTAADALAGAVLLALAALAVVFLRAHLRREFFGKDAGALGPSESALLAAVLPAPERFRVEAPSGYVRQRQGWIARQVRNLGGAGYLEAGDG